MALERDMTVGDPGRIILDFTVPVFLGNIFQQVYSMVDTIIVGQFVGTKALAAVGATGTVNFLILGFLLGVTAGFTVPAAQEYGAGRMDRMRRSVGNAAALSAVITVVMTALSCSCMRALLTFMNTPRDIFGMSYTYIMIICAGMATQVLYNLMSSILRAIGNSRTPLYFLILSAVLNIFLDLLFVVTFHMGVAGAAYATVVSQGVSGFLCLVYTAIRVPVLRLHAADFVPDRALVFLELKVGLPMAFQYSITAIGTIMVQSSLNLLGSMKVAAFSASVKIEQMMEQFFTAQGVTMASYCAQNTGAGRYDRIRTGIHRADRQGFLYAVVVGVLMFFFGKYFTYLFVRTDAAQLIDDVGLYLRCAGIFLIPLAVIFIYRNSLQGMGYGLLPMIAGVVELAGRAGAAVISGHLRSYLGICLSSPVAWVLAAGYLLIAYRWAVIRKEKRSSSARAR